MPTTHMDYYHILSLLFVILNGPAVYCKEFNSCVYRGEEASEKNEKPGEFLLFVL